MERKRVEGQLRKSPRSGDEEANIFGGGGGGGGTKPSLEVRCRRDYLRQKDERWASKRKSGGTDKISRQKETILKGKGKHLHLSTGRTDKHQIPDCSDREKRGHSKGLRRTSERVHMRRQVTIRRVVTEKNGHLDAR